MYKILCLRPYGISMMLLFNSIDDLFGSWIFHFIYLYINPVFPYHLRLTTYN